MKRRCPRFDSVINSSGSAALDESHAAHLRVCAECREERRKIEDLADLAGELPWSPPPPARLEEVRSALLLAVENEPRPAERPSLVGRHRERFAKAAIAIAVAIAVVAAASTAFRDRRGAGSPVQRATVHSSSAARFVHESGDADSGRAEKVRLSEGVVRLSVEKLRERERFVVATGDAEVEVRGTSFEVVAERDRLTAVHVWTGAVEVRWRGEPAVLLRPGDSWWRPDRSHDEARGTREVSSPRAADDTPPGPEYQPSPEVSATHSRHAVREPIDHGRTGGLGTAREPAVTARAADDDAAEARAADDDPTEARAADDDAVKLKARATDDAAVKARAPDDAAKAAQDSSERAFRDAWAAFARGDMAEAAELFEQVERGAPGSALAEDAVYGRSVALARAGRRDEAIEEMRRFLDRHAASARAEEVSVALGWLLLESGEPREAERCFERGAKSAVSEVRKSAERGLGLTRR